MPTLDAIYTTDEAAGRLRLTRRALLKRARDLGACSKVGRYYLFSEADLLAIWQAMRVEPKRPRPSAINLPLPYVGDGIRPRALEFVRRKKGKA